MNRARLALGLWLGAGLTAALILAWLVVAPDGWRQGTVLPLLIDVILTGLVVLAWTAHRRVGSLWLREANVTASMEESAGLAPGVLRGSLELARAIPPGVSSSLALQAAVEALTDLRGGGPKSAGRLAGEAALWIRRATVGLAVLTATVALLTLASPSRSFAAWSGLASPFGLLAGPTLPPLEVSPGSAEVLRGADVPLTVTAPGRTAVMVHWQAAGDVAVEESLDVVADRAGLILRGVTARTEYWVVAPDGAISPTYELQPIDPLLVSDVTVALTFPAHTGRFPEEYRTDIPPLDIPAGSRFAIRGQASRPLSFAGLEGPLGEEELQLAVSGRDFEGSWIPRASGVYPWRFTDTEGDPAEVAPPPLELTLVPDSAPDVAVLVPGKDTLLPVSLRQPLVLEAADDYGLDRLELIVYRVTAFGDRLEPVVSPMQVGGTRGALLRPVMDLTRWELLPGDTVRYFVRAVDNAPSPNMSETPEYVLRPPTPADLRREAQERLDDATRGVEELAERADEQAQEAQELERQLDNPQEPERGPLDRPETQDRVEFQEQEDIRGAMEDQEALLNAIDSLEMELAQLDRDLEAAGLGDPELQRQLEELQRLMEELAPESEQERIEELTRRLEEMNASEADQTLREISADQEALRDRLEEALEAFKRAAMEQDFRATAAEAEELAQQEEALADAMAESDDPELRADQQQTLEEQAEGLQERIDRLQERLAEAGEETAREAVEEAAQQGEQAQQSMSEAQQQSRMGQTQEAAQSAQEAAESMNQMSQQLQQAQQDMAEQMMEAFQEALQETATDALTMAREQAGLRGQMQGAGQEELANMRGDQSALLQGVRSMADNLSMRDRMSSGEDDRDVASQIGQAMQAIEQTLAALEDQRGRMPSPLNAAEQAVGALNQVALAAMAAAQQAGEMGQSQSAQQMMEQMEQLAQQQGSINSQTGQLTPMQLGEQAMAQQLQDAAERQQDVAEELEELGQTPGAQEQSLGDLEAMALEAMELAARLAGNRLDAETLQRQEQLFHRMLDAGRSLEKDEFSEERESAAAGEFEREDVDALSSEDLGALRFRLPQAEILRRLSPAQRQMVLDYFERLNRAERRPSGGSR